MAISTTNQAYIFLATVYVGLLIGILYDIYRAFRMIIRAGQWITAILDLTFWVLGALIFFLMLFRVNGGLLRLFCFLGLALGWGLYALTIGGLVTKILMRIYSIIKGIILWPIDKISRGLKWLGSRFKVKTRENKNSSN